MATWSGIEYYEDAKGSPHESWATDASKATRTLLFFGADRTTGPDVADREIIAEYLPHQDRTVPVRVALLEQQSTAAGAA